MQTRFDQLITREAFGESTAGFVGQIGTGPAGSLSRLNSIARSRSGVVLLIGFTILSLFISFGFFAQEINNGYSSLSGDELNILAVCAKKDHPDRFQGDQI